MHELSLAESILRMLEQTRVSDPFTRITQLRLEAGALCGVEISSLRFALEAIAPGTCLQGALIVIEEPAGSAWCTSCSQNVVIHDRWDPCPGCGETQLQITGGHALRVVDVQVV